MKKNIKDILCIIPARMGSKAIKLKNFKKLNNKPLIQYSIDTAKKIKKYCDIVISSDYRKIKKIIIANNLTFYGLRPKKLSGDKIETLDVVKYELRKIQKILQKKFKYILLLQPTSPIRDHRKIIKAIMIIKKKKFINSVISIKDVDANHPARMKILRKDNTVVNFLKNKKENMQPRQNLKKIYIRSGSFYLIKVNKMLKENSLVSNKCYGIVVKDLEASNIDNIQDFKILDMNLKRWT
jgi:CMP-N,N'-diacetyllegionaminic acid synthase